MQEKTPEHVELSPNVARIARAMAKAQGITPVQFIEQAVRAKSASFVRRAQCASESHARNQAAKMVG